MKKTTYLRHPSMRIGLTVVSLVAIVAGIVLAGAVPQSTQASKMMGMNVLYNGSFEGGFHPEQGCGLVGNGWHCFHNNGAANYGFYDDQWDPVVYDGEHSTLIEVNTKGVNAADPDRYAGISQTVELNPHAKYKLSLSGMIRTTAHWGDPWRYRVQVGMSPGPYADWRMVHKWHDVGWDTYHDRLEPGRFNHYMTVLKAPAEVATLYIRVWKKWGVPNEEIDVNLDAISLVEMGGHGGGMLEKPMGPPAGPEMGGQGRPNRPGNMMGGQGGMLEKPMGPEACEVVVKPGDSVGAIALEVGTSITTIAKANHLQNPDLIYIGQTLLIPDCGEVAWMAEETPTGKPEEPAAEAPPEKDMPEKDMPEKDMDEPKQGRMREHGVYVVAPGDTLSGIAAAHGVNLHAVAKMNGIGNVNFIYVGQELRIP